MLTVMTSSGSATSEAPSAAASLTDFPISRCRWMFSNTTMELSTNVPTARASPPSVMMLMVWRSEEHTSELQSLAYLVCRLLLEKKKKHIHPVQQPTLPTDRAD